MSPEAALGLIEAIGVVPSVRATSAQDARFAAEAVHAAGLEIIEVTMTTPNALAVIGVLAKSLPDALIGAGTVLDATTARRCIDAGAGFITSPGFARSVVDITLRCGVLALPGAVTPTDVMAASDAGASVVKVFPCAAFGGSGLVRALRTPFPNMRLVAAGGVRQEGVGDLIRAGAIAVGVGNELVPRRAIATHDRDWIAELVHRFRHAVQDAREEGSRAIDR
jgi:2-dehydro-3-deoxyphosphogluconate aldolase / (4S)-4-hydroxy-2-oxoglutarate aldolase